jgi:hypothetical protein
MSTPKDESPDNMSQEELAQNLQSSKAPRTTDVPNSSLEQLFKIPENRQYSYATFTETFERYKVRIDLFKWLIGTVGLTIITFIINWGFKDREQGLVELTAYDKYASDNVVYAKNPKNRMLLAQFFANVTPSEKLKRGWKAYLDVVKVDVDSFDNRLARIQLLVPMLAKDTGKSEQAKVIYYEAKETKDKLEGINDIKLVDEVTPAVTAAAAVVTAPTPAILPVISFRKTAVGDQSAEAAASFELSGFKALLSRDLKGAIYNFTRSENALNGYHMVYDIGRYLESLKGFSDDDASWKKIYQDMLQRFSWKMPAEMKEQLTIASK